MTDASPLRVVGILPALGSGLTDLRRTGQHERLLAYDLRHYGEAYDRIYYFSYFRESLAEFTRDPFLLERVTVLPRRGPWPKKVYALLLPLIYHREFRQCEALRVLQFPGVIPALLARLLFRIPFIVTYGYHYADVARVAGSRVKPALYRVLERIAFRWAAGVIVTSREMEAWLRSRRCPARVGYFPNGVDTASFAPLRREEPERAWRSVLYVGRFEREKNLGRLMDALALIKAPPVRFIVIGDGSLRAELEHKSSVAGVQAEFRGVLCHGELPKHLNDADVFVLPSLTEGHPKALIEAMACGLPCAASRRGGIPTMLEENVTGLLFDPEDPLDIARAIERLLTDRELARRLGQNARASAVALYDAHVLLKEEVRWVRQLSRSEKIRDLFEQYAETFPTDGVLPEFVIQRLRVLAPRTPRAVLDLGAGDGRFLEFFATLFPPSTLLVGCEISVRRARRIRAKGFRVVVAQSEALPFKSSVFELVTMIEVIEHTRSPGLSLDEVRRVLRLGGRLVLTTPNYPVKRLYDLRAALRTRDVHRLKDDPTHLSPLSARRLQRLLADRFDSVALEGMALLGESRSRWIQQLKGSNLGLRLANKVFAVCEKGTQA